MENLEQKIHYNPPEILEFMKESGSVDIKTLGERFEWDEMTAKVVTMDMFSLSLITTSDFRYDEKEGRAYLQFGLNEEYMKRVDIPRSRTIMLKPLPDFSRLLFETTSDLIRTYGLPKLEAADPADIQALVEQRKRAILMEFDSEELRGLAQDLRTLEEI